MPLLYCSSSFEKEDLYVWLDKEVVEGGIKTLSIVLRG